jgi:cytochrome P450 PksS
MNPNTPTKMYTPEFSNNAHQHFAWMRQEAPTHKVEYMRRKSAYIVTRYDDVVASFKDPRLVKNPNHTKASSRDGGMFWMPKTLRPLLNNMLNTDEPDHRRLRNLVHKAFTPRRIAQLETRVEAITNELLDKAMQQGQVDLIESFAQPLPMRVIAEMIGIPNEDLHKVSSWGTIAVNPAPLNMLMAIPRIMSFMRYIEKLAEKRRQNPQDDLLTALVQAEEDGDKFSKEELQGMVFLLFTAGHETTVSLISNGLVALLTHPDQLDLLRSDYSLMDSAIEEMLRFNGALKNGELSFATEAFVSNGVEIPKGSTVLQGILSANRDETVFDNPNELDITRTPNKHLAFGHGIHYCLGAPLARLEAKVALCNLLERSKDLRLTVSPDQLKYLTVMLINRLEKLPVAL